MYKDELIGKYIERFEELGWRYHDRNSMLNYYVFVRGTEMLVINVDKMKMIYEEYDEDALGAITYETLKIVMDIFKEAEDNESN